VLWQYCPKPARKIVPTALITTGNLLSASSAGLLVYIADFMGPKSRGSIELQIESYVAVLFGAGGMSLMAEWVWHG